MTNKNLPAGKYSFFAAANGYSGFRSYFDKIFNPKDYDAIYILKGGEVLEFEYSYGYTLYFKKA